MKDRAAKIEWLHHSGFGVVANDERFTVVAYDPFIRKWIARIFYGNPTFRQLREALDKVPYFRKLIRS